MSVKLSPEFIEFINDVMVAAFFTDILKRNDAEFTPKAKAAFKLLMVLDLNLIQEHLNDFKKHKCSREVVEKFIAQAD